MNGTWAALFRLTACELAIAVLITTISGHPSWRYCYVIRLYRVLSVAHHNEPAKRRYVTVINKFLNLHSENDETLR